MRKPTVARRQRIIWDADLGGVQFNYQDVREVTSSYSLNAFRMRHRLSSIAHLFGGHDLRHGPYIPVSILGYCFGFYLSLPVAGLCETEYSYMSVATYAPSVAG